MDCDAVAALPLTEFAALKEVVGSLNRSPGPRVIPGRSIPVPLSVSESSRRTIALPYRDAEWKLEPADAADWRKAVAELAATTAPVVAQIADRLGVQVAESTIAGVPLPAALALQTPWADLDEVGDSLRTNEWLDNVLVSYRGVPERADRLYADGHDFGDPSLSPLRGDFSGFPPTMLLSGTRDLFLSLTVLVHRKLRRAGVPADLHVVEGASHFHFFLKPFAAESEDVFTEMAFFLDRYLVG
jgi:pimeloyl-ACP methyl ester carboxylesterase